MFIERVKVDWTRANFLYLLINFSFFKKQKALTLPRNKTAVIIDKLKEIPKAEKEVPKAEIWTKRQMDLIRHIHTCLKEEKKFACFVTMIDINFLA